MRRYHFSIGGGTSEAPSIGIAGSLFASDDAEALDLLQKILDKVDTDALLCRDQHRGNEPAIRDARPGLSYVSAYSNGLLATREMFDEIETEDDDEPEPSADREPIATVTGLGSGALVVPSVVRTTR